MTYPGDQGPQWPGQRPGQPGWGQPAQQPGYGQPVERYLRDVNAQDEICGEK